MNIPLFQSFKPVFPETEIKALPYFSGFAMHTCQLLFENRDFFFSRLVYRPYSSGRNDHRKRRIFSKTFSSRVEIFENPVLLYSCRWMKSNDRYVFVYVTVAQISFNAPAPIKDGTVQSHDGQKRFNATCGRLQNMWNSFQTNLTDTVLQCT